MNRDQIVSALNQEIASLTSARDLLIGTTPATPRGPGRPTGRSKGSTGRATSLDPTDVAPKARRPLSVEAKARIAEAQRRRWAAAKKGTKAEPVSAKQSSPASKAALPKKAAPAAAKKVATKARNPVPKKASAQKSTPPAAPATAGSRTE